jgi:hypothetical protein
MSTKFPNFPLALKHEIDSKKDVSATVIRMVLICSELNGNSSGIPILSHFIRDSKPWPHGIRSKVIVFRPKCIDILGIHFVWRNNALTCSSVNTKVINDQDLLVFHYRSCESNANLKQRMNKMVLKKERLMDESMKRFSKQIQTFIDQYLD